MSYWWTSCSFFSFHHIAVSQHQLLTLAFVDDTQPGLATDLGMVWYASEMSWMKAWYPSGKQWMMRHIVEKVPQVQGKSWDLMAELIDDTGFVHGGCGWEKSCTAWNFPSFLGLGMRERSDDWKGPMIDSSLTLEKGRMYLPFWNSFSTISLYASGYLLMDGLLLGIYVCGMLGIPTLRVLWVYKEKTCLLPWISRIFSVFQCWTLPFSHENRWFPTLRDFIVFCQYFCSQC